MSKKILLVEDDEFLGKVINRKLEKEDYIVIRATDGEEGITKAEEENPDLILLDIILPGMDGFEVLAKLKSNPAVSKIPVIILSNLGAKDEIKKGLDLGADDYLVKAHFNPSEITSRIEAVLNK